MAKECTRDCAHCSRGYLEGRRLACGRSNLELDFSPDKGCEHFESWQDLSEEERILPRPINYEDGCKELANTRKVVIAWRNGRFSELQAGDVGVGKKFLALFNIHEPSICIPLKDIRWYSFGKPVHGNCMDADYMGENNDHCCSFSDLPTKSYTLPRPVTLGESVDKRNKELVNTKKVVVCWKDGKTSDFEAGIVRLGSKYLAMFFLDRDTILVPLSGIRWFFSEKPVICATDENLIKEFKAIRSE